jgi:spoIIIJ-associated protein
MSARTVKEATDLALEELGVDESDAEIEVIEEPRPGLFGRTRGQAQVRARVAPRPHPPKQERRDRSSRKRRGRPEAQGGGPATAPKGDGQETGPGESRDGGGRRRRPSEGRGEGGSSSAPSGTDARGGRGAREGRDTTAEPLPFDDHVACVERFLAGLLDAFGVDATIEVAQVDDETREVRVVGDDLGLLIGPRGLTLQAVHELARTVVYRTAPDGQEGRVRIDVGGYRERRRHALEQFATKIAHDVRDSGRAKALEPMSPPDRKVVHDTINAVEGVRTTSEGEEPRRRVIVVPDT